MIEKKINKDQVEQITNQIWRIFNSLRGVVKFEDFEVVLFILSAYKDELLDNSFQMHSWDSSSKLLNSINAVEKYKKIVNIYAPIIVSLPHEKTEEILHYIHEININDLQNNFPAVFDNILYNLSNSQGKMYGEFIQPIELSRFVLNLANLPEDASIYNPFAGLASFGIFLKQNQSYYGQEINQRTWALGMLRLLAYNSKDNVNYAFEDSINKWAEKSNFDLIVANPPYKFRISNFSSNHYNIKPGDTAESFLVERGIESILNGGQLITVLPVSFLFNGGKEKRYREMLVNNKLIDTIVSLPTGLLKHTGIAICIIVFKKEDYPNKKVRLVEAKNFVISNGPKDKRLDDEKLIKLLTQNSENDFVKLVSAEEIRASNYDLNVPRYFAKKIAGVKLVEISSFITGNRPSAEASGKYVRVRNLKENGIENALEINSIDDQKLPHIGIRKIEESCLLVTTRWKTLKPTYFKFEGEPIYISHDILAIKIDESKVSMNYLINELHADYVKEQITSYRVTGVVPLLRRDDFFNIKIELLSLEEQNKKYYFETNNFIETSVNEAQQEYVQKKINIEDENSFLRHQIAGSLKSARGSLKFIKKILEEKVVAIAPDLFELKADDILDSTLLTYLNNLERDLNSINKSVNRAGDKIDLMDLHIENFDLLLFLKEYKNGLEARSKNFYSVILNLDENAIAEYGITTIHIDGDKDLLRKMLDNIIENAEKHAFSYGINKGNLNKIEFFMMYDFENFTVQLDISNTGNPIPENLTHEAYTRKGSSSGATSGDGTGGWFINEVMKIHKGKFGFTDETGPEGIESEFVTSIELTFPVTPMI